MNNEQIFKENMKTIIRITAQESGVPYTLIVAGRGNKVTTPAKMVAMCMARHFAGKNLPERNQPTTRDIGRFFNKSYCSVIRATKVSITNHKTIHRDREEKFVTLYANVEKKLRAIFEPVA